MIKPLGIIFLGAITAGCATTEQTAALECGAGGAVVTAALCKIMGGDNAKCAAASAGVGATAAGGCYLWSSKLKKDEDALKGHEDDLDYRLRYVHSVNETMAQSNDAMRQKIASLNEHNTVTAQQVSSQSTRQGQLAERNKRIDDLINESQNSIAKQKDILAKNRQFQATHPNSSTELAAQIKREESILNDTERQARALAGMRQSV
jgi:hypothetical protein